MDREPSNRRMTNLTSGKGSSWNPVWAPDNGSLAFYSDRDGAARLWIWDRRGRPPPPRERGDRVADVTNRETIRWSPDGRSILARLLPEHSDSRARRGPPARDRARCRSPCIYGCGGHGARVSKLGKSDAGRIEDSAADFIQSAALTNRELADLGVVDVATGNVRRLVRRPTALVRMVA